jgi:hypothetical protein
MLKKLSKAETGRMYTVLSVGKTGQDLRFGKSSRGLDLDDILVVIEDFLTSFSG